jgi:hypothetical protein
MYKTKVKPVAECGSEIWPLTEMDVKRRIHGRGKYGEEYMEQRKSKGYGE